MSNIERVPCAMHFTCIIFIELSQQFRREEKLKLFRLSDPKVPDFWKALEFSFVGWNLYLVPSKGGQARTWLLGLEKLACAQPLLQEGRCGWWGRFAHWFSWVLDQVKYPGHCSPRFIYMSQIWKRWKLIKKIIFNSAPATTASLLFLRIKELSQWTWIDSCIRFLLRRYIMEWDAPSQLFLEFWFHSKIEKVQRFPICPLHSLPNYHHHPWKW